MGGLSLWLEKVEGHSVVLPRHLDKGAFPPHVDELIRSTHFRHRLASTLRTPGGRTTELELITAQPDADLLVKLFDAMTEVVEYEEELEAQDAIIERRQRQNEEAEEAGKPLPWRARDLVKLPPVATPRLAGTFAQREALSSDIRWFLHIYRATKNFIRSGRVLPNIAVDAERPHGQKIHGAWRLADDDAIARYIEQVADAAPGVITTNGGVGVAHEAFNRFCDILVPRLLGNLAGTSLELSTNPVTRAFLYGESFPRSSKPSSLSQRIGEWSQDAAASRIDLAVVIEPVPDEVAEALSERMPQLSEPHFMVRLMMREDQGVPIPVRHEEVSDEVLRVLAQKRRVIYNCKSLLGQKIHDPYKPFITRREELEESVHPVIREYAAGTGDWDALFDITEMADFIAGPLECLKANDVPILWPKGWIAGRPKARVSAVDPYDTNTHTRFGLDELVKFNIQVALGDTELSMDEIMELLISQEGLVRLHNGWLNADAEDVAQLREEIALLMGGTAQKLAGQLRRLDKEIEKAFRASSRGHFNARQEATTALRLLQKQRMDVVAELRQALIAAQAEKTGSTKGWNESDSEANQQLVTSLKKMRELKMQQAASGLDDPLLLIDIAPTEEEQNANRLQSSWVSAAIDGENFPVAPQPIELPDTVEAELRHYQKRGVDWLYWMSKHGLGAVLADDMGLGKTLQVLAFLAAEKAEWEKRNAEAEAAGVPEEEKIPWKPTVVIAPTSVLSAWKKEAARFVPSMSVYVHHGPNRVHDEKFAAIMAETDLCVTSYNLLTRDIIDLCQVEWAHVVVDEAQMIKNTATAAAKAARKIPTDHRIALTGTPVENRLAELRSIIDFCNPGALGSAKFFRHTYARPIEGEDNQALAAHLKQITSVFILRRVKTDTSIIDDLPEKEEHIIKVRLTEEQATLYQAMVEHLSNGLARAGVGQASQMGRRGLILAALTRFKQICNHPAHFLADGSGILDKDGNHRSGKVEELMRLIDQAVAKGEKMIIFTQYKAFGKILQPYLSEHLKEEVPFLHGAVSRQQRSGMVREFQAPEGPHVMILSLRAGGTGLTLTAANHVVHMDRWWNPAVENQATDRAFRIGQTKDVMVHKMVSEGTMEEAIHDVLVGKLVLVRQVLGEGEGWITELSEEQLMELVEYSRRED